MTIKTNVPLKFKGKKIGVGEPLPQDLLDHLASGRYSEEKEKPKTSSKKKAAKKKTDEE